MNNMDHLPREEALVVVKASSAAKETGDLAPAGANGKTQSPGISRTGGQG